MLVKSDQMMCLNILLSLLKVNHTRRTEYAMSCTGNSPNSCDVLSLVFNEFIIHSVMFIAGHFLMYTHLHLLKRSH